MIWTRPRKVDLNEHVFPRLIISTNKLDSQNLSNDELENMMLIAIKYEKTQNIPIPIGYLYLVESTQKIYYSSGVSNRPEFLFDWNNTLSGGLTCQDYQSTITNDGDVIFLRNSNRANPIIYPFGDYGNPQLIDFGVAVKPFGFITDASVDHHPTGDYFIFGDYFAHNADLNDDPVYIWKVSKPYNNPANWVQVDTWYHRYFESGEGSNPTREVGHIHTAKYDSFSGAWVVTTGDIDAHCRILISTNDGSTWTDVANGHQKYRMVGLLFLSDGAYWGTDSPDHHYLYKANRDGFGNLDFSNLQQITPLKFYNGGTNKQPTYTTCYIRNPEGILTLDRAEPRPDGKFDLEFWSFEDQTLHTLAIFDRVVGEIDNDRHGFGNQCATVYESIIEPGVICGATSVTRRMKLDLLGNSVTKRIGNTKIQIIT